MTPEEVQRLQACTQEIAQILYRNPQSSELVSLESIEKSVRRQMLEHVSSEIAVFLSKQPQAQILAESER